MVKFNPKVSNSRHYLSKQMASLDYTMHVAINTLRIFEYTSQPWNFFFEVSQAPTLHEKQTSKRIHFGHYHPTICDTLKIK
jgi:hypothetical protein